MTPLSLGASAAAGTGGAGTASTAAGGNGKDGSGFDALLQTAPPPTPRPAPKPAAKAAPEAQGKGADDSTAPARPTAPSGTADEAAADSADKPATAAETDARPSQDAADPDELPWPPPGLSGLAVDIPVAAPPDPATAGIAAAIAATVAGDPRAATAAAVPADLTAPLPATPQPPGPAMALPNPAVAAPAAQAPQAAADDALAQLAMDLPPSAPRADASNTLPAMEPSAATAALFGPLLQNLAAVADARPATAFPPALSAPVDMQSADFDDAVGARVGWLADQKIGHAHIRVTPNDLGPVEVKLQLDGDRVHATFSSAHAEVRHALENGLPKLREMLGEQGLQLAHADVGQQSSHPHASDGEGQAASGGAGTGTDADGAGAPATPGVHAIRLRGLLDAYA